MKKMIASGYAVALVLGICLSAMAGEVLEYETTMYARLGTETSRLDASDFDVKFNSNDLLDFVGTLRYQGGPVMCEDPKSHEILTIGNMLPAAAPFDPPVIGETRINESGYLVVSMYLEEEGLGLLSNGAEFLPILSMQINATDPWSATPARLNLLAIPTSGNEPDARFVELFTGGEVYSHVNPGTDDAKKFDFFVLGVADQQTALDLYDAAVEGFVIERMSCLGFSPSRLITETSDKYSG